LTIDDNKIIALSKIRRFNINQYFVIDMNGNLVLNGSISAWEICFSKSELIQFKKISNLKDPDFYMQNLNGVIHFDWERYKPFHESDKTREAIRGKSCSSHIAPFAIESSDIHIDWYSPIDPKAKMAKDDRGNLRIKVKDNTGVYIYVP